MKNEVHERRVVDLGPEELNSLAAEAWRAAAREALAKGLTVTGSRDGRRFRYHPDGKVEDLGPAQTKELSALAQKVASDTAEPIKTEESEGTKGMRNSA